MPYTVREAKRLKCWKIMPIFFRFSRSCRPLRAVSSLPPTITLPSVGRSSRLTHRARVDLPVPLSPMRAMRSPPSTFKVTPSKRRLSPKDLARFRTPSTSSPWNSAAVKRASIFLALVGLEVVRIRSMRRSMFTARR